MRPPSQPVPVDVTQIRGGWAESALGHHASWPCPGVSLFPAHGGRVSQSSPTEAVRQIPVMSHKGKSCDTRLHSCNQLLPAATCLSHSCRCNNQWC